MYINEFKLVAALKICRVMNLLVTRILAEIFIMISITEHNHFYRIYRFYHLNFSHRIPPICCFMYNSY